MSGYWQECGWPQSSHTERQFLASTQMHAHAHRHMCACIGNNLNMHAWQGMLAHRMCDLKAVWTSLTSHFYNIFFTVTFDTFFNWLKISANFCPGVFLYRWYVFVVCMAYAYMCTQCASIYMHAEARGGHQMFISLHLGLWDILSVPEACLGWTGWLGSCQDSLVCGSPLSPALGLQPYTWLCLAFFIFYFCRCWGFELGSSYFHNACSIQWGIIS